MSRSFLIVGMAIGPEALGLINIKADSALNQIILLFGASYILFDGGASLRFKVLKRVWITIVVIATVGVVITAVVTGIARILRSRRSIDRGAAAGRDARLDGPGDAVPIFRQIHIRDRVAQTVMSESAFNDAMGAIVTFAVLGVAMGTGEFSLTSATLDLLKQSIIGIVAGVALGYLGRTAHRARTIGIPRGICAGGDTGGRHRCLFRGRWLAGQRVHGGVCVRHHDRKQGRLSASK